MNTLLKKIIRDYTYHQETFVDVKDISDQAELEFRENLQKNHPDAAKALLGEGEEDMNRDEKIKENESLDHGDKEFKKIYRKITMQCHPDRVGDDSKLLKIYQSAVDANDNYDWGLLLKLALELNIEIDFDSIDEERINNIENNTIELKKKIQLYESSMAYKWYLLKDLSAKEQFMLSCAQIFKNSLGIK